MDRPRLIRGLRIAWSVWWGILCVLLIVMWVRSYWYADSVTRTTTPSRGIRVSSFNGYIEYDTGISGSVERIKWRLSESPEKAPTQWHTSLPRFGVGWHAIPYWLPLMLAAALAATPWV